jgi:hypothetical protein
MSFRRFLNLVSKDSLKCVYTLRHMDTSRLFLPTISNKGIGGGRSTPMEDDCRPLPEPVANFYSSHCPGDAGQMTFMPFGDMVIGTDLNGGALIYDPDRQALRSLPNHGNLKRQIIVSQTFCDKLYVIDEHTNCTGTRTFEALVYTPNLHGKWHWQALPPPPPPPGVQDGATDPTSIKSCAVVAGGSRILMSAAAKSREGTVVGQSCTHSFDTERLVWRPCPFDWVLPFSGCTEYVPELNELWFGISSREHGSVFCASDLSWSSESHPPVLHAVFEGTVEDRVPPDWHLISAHATHLGVW